MLDIVVAVDELHGVADADYERRVAAGLVLYPRAVQP
jgi:hypothetical protein